MLADSFSDAHNERLILLAVAGMIAVGVAMTVATVVWWRNNRIEHAALAPLEVMGERSWWKGSFAERRRRLDDARGRAREVHGAGHGEAVDLAEAQRAFRPGFDDLLADDVEPGSDVAVTDPAGADAAGADAGDSESSNETSPATP